MSGIKPQSKLAQRNELSGSDGGVGDKTEGSRARSRALDRAPVDQVVARHEDNPLRARFQRALGGLEAEDTITGLEGADKQRGLIGLEQEG